MDYARSSLLNPHTRRRYLMEESSHKRGWLTPLALALFTLFLSPLIVQVVGGWILERYPSFPEFSANSPAPSPVSCPSELEEAHGILSRNGRDPSPPKVSYSITPSQAFPGRVRVIFGWMNPVGIRRASIAVSGIYGYPNPGDDYISTEQTSAATGECWNWYSMIHRNGSQPEVVDNAIDGLWPNHTYCYFASYEGDDQDGWSKPTDIDCFETTWRDDWGTPEYPSQYRK